MRTNHNNNNNNNHNNNNNNNNNNNKRDRESDNRYLAILCNVGQESKRNGLTGGEKRERERANKIHEGRDNVATYAVNSTRCGRETRDADSNRARRGRPIASVGREHDEIGGKETLAVT